MAREDEAPSHRLSDHETVSDLKAAVGARRELGAEMEDDVLETFLARVEQRLGTRVPKQMEAPPAAKASRAQVESPIPVVGSSLVLGIPSLAIAGDVAGTVGLILVVAALIAINLLYFIDRWVRMG